MSQGNPLGPELFRFVETLTANNRREWFHEHKGRYEDEVKEPALAFISAFGPRLAKISPHFTAIPKAVGGSLFRIYRDTRFSRDKTPYKTHVGIHFRHENAKDAHAPGYYLHLDPTGSFLGVGIWRPPGEALQRIRQAIVDRPAGWKRARNAQAFRRRFELEGDALKSAPRGFDRDHPLIGDLRRKDFVGVCEISEAEVVADRFPVEAAAAWRAASPFMRFLCQALDVPF